MGAQSYKIPVKRRCTILKDLKGHPNFKMPNPYYFEDPITFACACISELISPVQENTESNEMECIELSKAIEAFKSDIIKIWGRQGLTTTPEYLEYQNKQK